MLNKKAPIALGIAVAALVLAGPSAASAATYADGPNAAVADPSIGVCEVSSVIFGAGFFQAGEHVPVSIAGTAAADATITDNTARSDGSMVASFRPPAHGQGAYELSFGGSRPYVATITVSDGHDAVANCDHDPNVTAARVASGDADTLAITGADVSPWMVGGGAAALALGSVLVGISMVRRARRG
ncbi:hypothetical protein Q9R19_03765 [Microbacterium sp. ARD32]|uniref:hypothetical protein n=1 Tax=Microbacterium sp. ARD32 TaxID=2962577 RepID=UPI002880E28E|nr:hypothetical protein [Microbacterium sp. ARD32]MDT0156738.1 hypothetical protein [Microbacterium sp. ARD32]